MISVNQLLNMIKSGYNPEQLILNVLETQLGNTPIGNNLLNLAKQGNSAEIEKIVRNLSAQQGIDFDKEFPEFKRRLGF